MRRSTYSSASYAAFRPSYPPALFNRVLAFHNANNNRPPNSGTLVDLGCGHGLIARALAPSFASVIALDPSAGMVEQARKLTTDQPRITIRHGSAEDLLSFIPGGHGSVDCVVAGQAAHWFDFTKVWPALARAVSQHGTLAFWGYKDHVVVGQPALGPIFDRFVYGREEPVPETESMARFWEQPGREILRGSYSQIVPPDADWEAVTRITWDPDPETGAGNLGDAPEGALWQRKTLKLGELESYVRTFSAFSGWQQAYPGRKSRKDGGEGDVVDLLFDEVVATVPEWKAKGEQGWRDIEVDTVWGTVILMARRR
ncbi:S-adenosyl-L-methionine-dependent methyltransferase [Apodospora peruviana]|uniref:S-adenosyl-L-methionine-dependent methyltransferase n=1 Tax=Apodospora peruviana TaxID=516989 RepID=A0AAE0M4G2_9PEZI|nr:S-adenosyl-L-methionine-dependent methyltransferase [Apodospora peruviana]